MPKNSVDPLIPARLAAITEIVYAEREVHEAIREAMTQFLTIARQLVLDQPLTAAAERETNTTSQVPPNLDKWPAQSTWERLLALLVLPVIARIFTQRFTSTLPAGFTAAVNAVRETFLSAVGLRLGTWPKNVFLYLRSELSAASGESTPQARARVERILRIDALSRDLQHRADEINEKLIDTLTDEQRRALLDELTVLLNKKDPEDSLWNPDAVRIARAEALAAYNGAAYAAWDAYTQATGKPVYKRWLATHDTHTRLSHRVADKQVRPLGRPFTVGGISLQFPGDPTGPPGEIWNCRCFLATVPDDEVDAAGDDYAAKLAALPLQDAQLSLTAASTLGERVRQAGLEWDEELQSRLRGPLRDYWVRGKGAAKIRWGTPGDFNRCVRHLRKYFPRDPKGLCANLHHEAIGFWPGREPAAHDGSEMGKFSAQLPGAWEGTLAPMGVPSGDGRMLQPVEPPRTRGMPVPLMRQDALGEGHNGAVIVGRIDQVWTEGTNLMGRGVFDLGSACGREAARLVAQQYANGVSVDLDDTTAELRFFDSDGNEVSPPEDEEGTLRLLKAVDAGQITQQNVLTSWRLMSATLVANPAFAEAKIIGIDTGEPDSGSEADGEQDPEMEESMPSSDLPLGDREADWDADAADKAMAAWATAADGQLDTEKYSQGHFWADSEADPTTQAAYKLPFATVIGDTLTAIPAGIFAAAAAVQGARGGVDIPEADMAGVKEKIAAYYGKMAAEFDDLSIIPPWEDQETNDEPMDGDEEAALVAALAPLTPPAQWFAKKNLPGPTPLTIDEDGHVYGHLATFDTCHIGFPGSCVRPPRSVTSYAHFNTGVVRTDDGQDVPVGKITLGTGHAEPGKRVRAATEHYDHTGTAVAVVRAYEDSYGIVVTGGLLPDVTDDQLSALRRSPLSGDWRQVGGNLELVAALAVNVPGFAVPRTVTASAQDRPLSLVAAGALLPADVAAARLAAFPEPPPAPLTAVDAKALAREMITELAAERHRQQEAAKAIERLGLDLSTRFAQVAARFGSQWGAQ